jgi:hypothetical protein
LEAANNVAHVTPEPEFSPDFGALDASFASPGNHNLTVATPTPTIDQRRPDSAVDLFSEEEEEEEEPLAPPVDSPVPAENTPTREEDTSATSGGTIPAENLTEPPAQLGAGSAEPIATISYRHRIARRPDQLTFSFDINAPPPQTKERFQAPVFPRFASPDVQGVAPDAPADPSPGPLDFSDEFGIERALREIAPPKPPRVSLPSVELQKPPPLEDITTTHLWAVYSNFVTSLRNRQ